MVDDRHFADASFFSCCCDGAINAAHPANLLGRSCTAKYRAFPPDQQFVKQIGKVSPHQ
jgi:hypothetical protein